MYVEIHHRHHIQEGLGLIPVPWILKLKLVPPSLPRSSYVLRPFGLYCSACLGILFVSILCMCCSHFSWYCFISFTIFSASKHSEYPQKKEADRHSSIFFIEKNLWSSAKWKWILENQNELWAKRTDRKRRHSKIYKKQKNNLAKSRDTDGW